MLSSIDWSPTGNVDSLTSGVLPDYLILEGLLPMPDQFDEKLDVLISEGYRSLFKKIIIFSLLCVIPVAHFLYVEEIYYLYAQSKTADFSKVLYAIFAIVVGYKSNIKALYISIIVLVIFLSNTQAVLLFAWMLITGFV